jgi:hypothetical protein
MFLRFHTRKKDGTTHRYWSVVENRRLRPGHTTQRTMLYWGEINDTQQTASDLHLRPIRHHVEQRVEAHILVCFLAYGLHVTVRKRL